MVSKIILIQNFNFCIYNIVNKLGCSWRPNFIEKKFITLI